MQQKIAKEAGLARTTGELAGKTAIVTGSTSGIGLGIAQAFAEAGMHVMLNGFGDKAEIEKIRAGIGETYGVKAGYSAADMMAEDARRARSRATLVLEIEADQTSVTTVGGAVAQPIRAR